jgi:hypothetical protein
VAAELHIIVAEDQQLNEEHVISRVRGWLNILLFRSDSIVAALRWCHQTFQSFRCRKRSNSG